MKCINCGNELNEDDNFCSKCGAQTKVKNPYELKFKILNIISAILNFSIFGLWVRHVLK